MWQMLIGVAWTNIGLLASCWLPDYAPRHLGRALFWFGVPIQVFALAHKSNFTDTPWLPAITVCVVLCLGFGLSLSVLGGLKIISRLCEYWKVQWLSYNMQSLVYTQKYYPIILDTPRSSQFQKKKLLQKRKLPDWMDNNSFQGSFILAAMLGNTMFIGMAIVPPLVAPQYLGWIVIFGIVHYLLGSYGIGVFLANYYGQTKSQNHLVHLANLLKIPTLWAFAIGYLSQPIQLPEVVDWLLQGALWSGVPTVFLLLGLQLGNLRGSNQLQVAFFPAFIRMLLLPGLIGIVLLFLGFASDARFAIVLMTGMPTNSANLILAEEYHLDPQLAASSIVISTLLLPLTVPLWYILFR
jgi:malate permease and related proteins